MAEKFKGAGKLAPTLCTNGDKWDNKGTYNKEQRPNGDLFGQHPVTLRAYINNALDGAQGNLIKLMYTLIDCEVGFNLTQQWIIDNTGIPKNKYYQARDILVAIGWLTYVETDASRCELYINYDYLWQQARLPLEARDNIKEKIKEARKKLGIS